MNKRDADAIYRCPYCFKFIREDRPHECRSTAGIVKLSPGGTNSTMFTACCSVAIGDYQPNCPKCGRPVIGYDANTSHERRLIRWKAATGHWVR